MVTGMQNFSLGMWQATLLPLITIFITYEGVVGHTQNVNFLIVKLYFFQKRNPWFNREDKSKVDKIGILHLILHQIPLNRLSLNCKKK